MPNYIKKPGEPSSLAKGNQGQAMVEYTIVAAFVVIAFIGLNGPFILALNSIYKLIVVIVSLPIP